MRVLGGALLGLVGLARAESVVLVQPLPTADGWLAPVDGVSPSEGATLEGGLPSLDVPPRASGLGTEETSLVWLRQVGEGNLAVLSQRGQGNWAELVQLGDHNQLELRQWGDGNQARLVQIGDHLQMPLIEQSGGARVEVIQRSP